MSGVGWCRARVLARCKDVQPIIRDQPTSEASPPASCVAAFSNGASPEAVGSSEVGGRAGGGDCGAMRPRHVGDAGGKPA